MSEMSNQKSWLSGSEEDRVSPYRTGDLSKTLGVSRASLVYYEKMGLINPQRDPDTGVREFDNKDVFDLVSYSALGNIGFTAKEIVTESANGAEAFNEPQLERYLVMVNAKHAYYEALRGAIDRMREIRIRDRMGPAVMLERIERHIFAEDGAQDGYLGFRSSAELDALIECVPISGFGIIFKVDKDATSWRWGRTVPTRLAAIVGIEHHFPLQVGGCDCVTMIARTTDERVPLPAEAFHPLYEEASRRGRRVAGDPFVPYIFPPHPGTPYKVCLPLE